MSLAGGGGGGMSAPNNLLSVCTIADVVHTNPVPTGTHRSFGDAYKINQSFVVGQAFNFLGGYFKLNNNGSFLGLYSVQQRITPTGHPIFYYYEFPLKNSIALEPSLNLRQSTLHIKTAGNISEKDFPLIENVMLVLEGKNNSIQFKVVWNYANTWNSAKPVVTAHGKMNCLIP